MESRVNVLADTAGHSHEAQHVNRHKGNKETDEPAPECTDTPFFVQGEAERFREPVSSTGEASEDHTTDNDVMEVCNQEQTVMQDKVCTRYCQQNPGHTTDGEGDNKADCPEHRGFELDTALIHGKQPVEYLHPGRNGDDHRGDTEEGVDVRTGAHGKEVVQPDDKGQNRNRDGCPYQ